MHSDTLSLYSYAYEAIHSDTLVTLQLCKAIIHAATHCRHHKVLQCMPHQMVQEGALRPSVIAWSKVKSYLNPWSLQSHVELCTASINLDMKYPRNVIAHNEIICHEKNFHGGIFSCMI